MALVLLALIFPGQDRKKKAALWGGLLALSVRSFGKKSQGSTPLPQLGVRFAPDVMGPFGAREINRC
jgi:hypothetical protein